VIRFRRFIGNVLAVTSREAGVLRNDKGFLSTVLAQPIILLLLFGYGLSNEPANVPWAVYDRSNSTPARRFVEDIQQTGYFLPPKSIRSYEEARALLGRQKAIAVLVIPRDFQRDLGRGRPQVQLLLDGSDPLTSARVGGYIGRVAAAWKSPRSVAPRVEDPLPMARAPAPIDLRQRFWFNPTLADRNFFLATLCGQLLTNICFSIASLGIVGERESGTFEQTLSLPITPIEIVLGKLLPLAIVSYFLFVVALIGAGLMFGLWPQGSWIALSIVTAPFIFSSLAIGVLVSSLARTSAQAVFITVFFIMPSFVLSGVMFPYQLMPAPIRAVGGLLPLRWYQVALRRIVSRGAGLEDVVVPFFAMLAIFAVLMVMIRWRLKPRLA
jgi:ABC-2 type transport system permease protein